MFEAKMKLKELKGFIYHKFWEDKASQRHLICKCSICDCDFATEAKIIKHMNLLKQKKYFLILNPKNENRKES